MSPAILDQFLLILHPSRIVFCSKLLQFRFHLILNRTFFWFLYFFYGNICKKNYWTSFYASRMLRMMEKGCEMDNVELIRYKLHNIFIWYLRLFTTEPFSIFRITIEIKLKFRENFEQAKKSRKNFSLFIVFPWNRNNFTRR